MYLFLHARIKRGAGAGPPDKSQKKIGFFSNTGPDPHKNHKVTKLAVNVWPSSARR